VPRRSLAVLVALGLALVASAGVYVGLHSVQRTANRNASLAAVYVLKGSVPRDESAAAAYAQGLIGPARLPRQFVPTGAVTDLTAIRHDVAQYHLPSGPVVVAAMFVPSSALHSVASQRVPAGDVAVSVSVDQAHGVAGLIQPGDHVDILVDVGGAQETALYRSVPVLAVDSTVLPAPGRPSVAAPDTADEAKVSVTLDVPDTIASTIASAADGRSGVRGGLYLAIDGAGSSSVPASVVSGTNLIPGGSVAFPPGPGTVLGGSLSTGSHIVRGEGHDNTP
jgi:pilus assembly protein CpaB